MSDSKHRCAACAGPSAGGSSRRHFLESAGSGFGMLAAAWLFNKEGAFAAEPILNPLGAKAPELPAKAKSVIWLFMHGGPSHVDTFDPKPMLAKFDGKPTPPSFGNVFLQFTKASEAPLLASRREFRKYGQSGLEVSDLFQNVARHADDLAVVRSCYHDGFTHSNALNWLQNGWPRLGRPSVGSWVVYGLGSESDNLPAFIVMTQGEPKSGPAGYSSGFLPAMYQGTVLRSDGTPILNIRCPEEIGAKDERDMLDTLKRFNERHLATRSDDSDLAARIAAYELAFRMQIAAPELVDISKETEATKKLYGMDDTATVDFGAKCLMARRLVERGVRFIQLYSGGGGRDWDGHNQCDKNHVGMARSVDKPIAGLLADLKVRGLLDSTLVIWGGEFGRTPMTDGNANGGIGQGRDHNPYGFTIWMAGGGVKGGKVIGATDDIGLQATVDKVHVHDLHGTILRLLGVDHKKLTYLSQGRNFRLTDVGGDGNIASRLIA